MLVRWRSADPITSTHIYIYIVCSVPHCTGGLIPYGYCYLWWWLYRQYIERGRTNTRAYEGDVKESCYTEKSLLDAHDERGDHFGSSLKSEPTRDQERTRDYRELLLRRKHVCPLQRGCRRRWKRAMTRAIYFTD